MFKRCIARPTLYSCAPARYQRISLRRESSLPKSVAKLFNSKSDNNDSNKDKKPPESWARFLGVRVGAIAVGYTVGKVYYYYNPKPGSTEYFVPYELVSREPITSTLSIFTLRSQNNGLSVTPDELRQIWNQTIWNVQFKQPQLQITRAYTPIPLGRIQDTDDLKFLVRRDPRGGEMSNYLHRLPPGSNIEMRGPYINHAGVSKAKNVIFIAGGTGIAPALQVAHAMFNHDVNGENDQPQEKHLHIIWANRSNEEIKDTNPILTHLTALQSTHSTSQSQSPQIHLTTLTDENKQFVTPSLLSSALDRAITNISISSLDPSDVQPTTEIFISGPDGFISYLAGPMVWRDGQQQQGPLGGVLAGVLKGKGVKTWESGTIEKGMVRVTKL